MQETLQEVAPPPITNWSKVLYECERWTLI